MRNFALVLAAIAAIAFSVSSAEAYRPPIIIIHSIIIIIPRASDPRRGRMYGSFKRAHLSFRSTSPLRPAVPARHGVVQGGSAARRSRRAQGDDRRQRVFRNRKPAN